MLIKRGIFIVIFLLFFIQNIYIAAANCDPKHEMDGSVTYTDCTPEDKLDYALENDRLEDLTPSDWQDIAISGKFFELKPEDQATAIRQKNFDFEYLDFNSPNSEEGRRGMTDEELKR